MKHFLIRLFYGLLFAMPLMLLTYVLAQAAALPQSEQPQDAAQPLNCPACHASFEEAWKKSDHSSATNATFKAAWEAQGQPSECLTCHVTGYNPDTGEFAAEGITCQACHKANQPDHPKEAMGSDRSAKACGACHAETYFEWQASQHRQAGVDCVACHDPHNTQLKTKDPSNQCATCHRERSSNFNHTQHSAQGMTCADCHLEVIPGADGQEGHARRDHSFTVRLTTCNNCHSYQMHDPSEVHTDNPTPEPVVDAMAAVQANVAAEPEPVSPIGFATLAGIFGLAVGAIVSPWLDRIVRRNNHKDQ